MTVIPPSHLSLSPIARRSAAQPQATGFETHISTARNPGGVAPASALDGVALLQIQAGKPRVAGTAKDALREGMRLMRNFQLSVLKGEKLCNQEWGDAVTALDIWASSESEELGPACQSLALRLRLEMEKSTHS